ncbi:TIGR03667 family PPOX class F420-dependent oxidoreductase [Actinosynnema sp. NPDC020468]|uniref:TIGR03667 family PPOX class F420-dependent oxidoreductase n=1 Tax=Actinosynnema sp. NPDC020468 TaxID=3154488 RepID=UPI0033DA5E09
MSTVLPDPSTEFGARVLRRLTEEKIAWITSVDRNGTPQPAPVWFLWEDDRLIVYTPPTAKRVERLKANPRTSVNLADEGGQNVVVLTGTLAVDETVPGVPDNPAYLAKYGKWIDDRFEGAVKFGATYSVAVVFTPEKVRGF